MNYILFTMFEMLKSTYLILNGDNLPNGTNSLQLVEKKTLKPAFETAQLSLLDIALYLEDMYGLAGLAVVSSLELHDFESSKLLMKDDLDCLQPPADTGVKMIEFSFSDGKTRELPINAINAEFLKKRHKNLYKRSGVCVLINKEISEVSELIEDITNEAVSAAAFKIEALINEGRKS